ncbi:ribonuclease H family protein [Paraliomyxa miuraensis]|uniref:ribonuclease H family protein n=1 Tax=Paraliomyxa miuraensis TaxID=376150 RepID=UPI00224E73CD|nr:ribonuclease H family protein [Paraliomyxa miuraensis]MCX4243031.1 ribonuclease H family protein [Paraliomyxa miuraensis]
MPRARYYVVFVGREPGVYPDWEACKAQVDGFPGAVHRSYRSAAEAERAWVEAGGDPVPLDDEPSPAPPARVLAEGGPPPGSIAVDAACSGNPGPMEYRGVDIDTGHELFRVGPMAGTNNIGEFLAIVHGLAWLEARRRPGPLYSDSTIAIGWVARGTAKTTLARTASTEPAWELLTRAQRWLRQGRLHGIEIRKWPTRRWGEIPADFGRK